MGLDLQATATVHRPRRRTALPAALAALATTLVGMALPAGSGAAVRTVYATGEIVPIPASIPHEEGDMVDRRILPDLRWIARRYPIYVTDGYSGALPNSGGRAGCRGCHVENSDHNVGLAVDIAALGGGTTCSGPWRAITRLARWAEPRQNRPRPPFRWVGYDGDAGHGCGHHLHLSWEHADGPSFRLAEWVQVFSVPRMSAGKPRGAARRTTKPKPAPPRAPSGGATASTPGGLGTGERYARR